jgi:uncharacterized protein YegL
MPSTLPLILREEPVTRSLLARAKISKPSIAVVYADGFGHVACIDDGRPLTWSEQVLSRYRTRYEVDLSDHRRTAQLDSSPLPARGDMYFFHSMVDVGFRVTDPASVVKRHVTDALSVVYNYLIDAFRPVTRRHEIKDAAGAETEINIMFQQPVTLEEGITIYRCRTRLLPDKTAQEYLRSLESADRMLHVGEAEHKVATASARQSQELADMAQMARINAESREHAAMAGRQIDLHGLIRAHLAKHPDETAYALELLARHEQAQLTQRDINDQRSMDLVRYMVEQGMIQAVDIELLRKQALGRVQEIASPTRPAELPAGSWDDPLPADSMPPLSLAAEPTPAREPGGAAAHKDPGAAVPVYVVVDESAADPGYFAALNDGIQALLADLAMHPEVMDAMWLALVGYAEDIQVRMPLTAVKAGSHIPEFSSRHGVRLGPVFSYLYRRIAEDVDQRKSRGIKVVRPSVYLICTTPPDDGPAWESSYEQLTDRTAFPLAPNICAIGIGQADLGTMQNLAVPPGAHGWIASEGVSLAHGARLYIEFVQHSITVLGQSYISGKNDMWSGQPEGFQAVSGRE